LLRLIGRDFERHRLYDMRTGGVFIGILVEEDQAAQQAAENQEMEDFDWRRDIAGYEAANGRPDRLVLRTVYNWSRFRFSNDPAFSDNPLPGLPEHFMRAELVYEHPSGIYFGPNLEASFQRYAVDMNNTLFAGRYALLGFKGGYRTRKGISFFVEGRNLTNEIYAATTGVIANANGADSAQFLPGDGRAVYSGIEFRWG
jgi:iron complex outermembrane receptor protein